MNVKSFSLKSKTVFITGASRGVGRAIALRMAREGASIVVAAKSTEENSKLGGTIYSVAKEIEEAGGAALPLVLDVRDEQQVFKAVEQAAAAFGGIDILVNNAGALFLAGTADTPVRKFDLLMAVNVRASFLCAQHCLPYLKKAENPHILNISPPLNLDPKWFKDHVVYTISKYGMSLCVLGMAEEFKKYGVGVNALWPRTTLATAAVKNLLGGEEAIRRSRKPEIMGDAAFEIFKSSSWECTGNFFIDEDLLRERGVSDFGIYSVELGQELLPDFFV